MFNCISGKHWWTKQGDADKCCNGYIRLLVIGDGENQQEAAGVTMGRAWVKVENVVSRGEKGPDPNCSNCGGDGGTLSDDSCDECWAGKMGPKTLWCGCGHQFALVFQRDRLGDVQELIDQDESSKSYGNIVSRCPDCGTGISASSLSERHPSEPTEEDGSLFEDLLLADHFKHAEL